MAFPAENRKYTYADLLEWDGTQRHELICGEPVMLASPSGEHQAVHAELFISLGMFLRGKRCQIRSGPIDVRLFEREDDPPEEVDTVVVPDLVVVCDPSKLDHRGIRGAPDLVVEILSPSTASVDMWDMYALYEKAGVREYWIVHPLRKEVRIWTLEDSRFVLRGMYREHDTVNVHVLEGCRIELTEVFRSV